MQRSLSVGGSSFRRSGGIAPHPVRIRVHLLEGSRLTFVALFSMLLLLGVATQARAASGPNISSLSPASAAIGATVTISGSGFGSSQGSSTVKFNGTAASVTSWKSTSISATVPSGATSGSVVVTVSGVSSNAVAFTVVPAPSITSLTPSSAAVGATFTVAGANFGAVQGAGTVKVNNIAATITSWSVTSIVAKVPSGATSGNVVVFASGVNSNGLGFTVLPAPTITSLSVTSGPVGTPVTITGTNFGSTQGTGTVSFNGTMASVTSWTSTSIQTAVPNGGSTGNVVVFASGVNSNGKTFSVTPSISSIWPTSGLVGTTVIITGSGFGTTQGTSTVKFNGKTATVSQWSGTSITATVPTGAATGNVIVTVSTASNGVLFTVGSAPVISSISPGNAALGAYITITGSFFGPTVGSSSVTINGAAARPSSWSNSIIIAPVPYNITVWTGSVIVTVNGLASNAVTFTAGDGATISGTITRSSDGNPVSGALVQTVGGSQGATSYTTGADGRYALSVQPDDLPGLPRNKPMGITVSVNGYVVAQRTGILVSPGTTTTVNLSIGVPVISSLSPPAGPVGTVVVIGGANFGVPQAGTSVTFNGIISPASSWSDSSITVQVPAGATSGPVIVTTLAQPSNSVAFTVGTGAITGTITSSAGGSAVAGALVEALQSDRTLGSANSSSDGTYTIGNLSPGTFDVRVSANGFGSSLAIGKAVTGVSPTTVNVVLQGPGTISGRVTQGDGQTAISGGTVVASQNGETLGTATTDSSGAYSIANISSGTYALRASAGGFASQTLSSISVNGSGNTVANFSLLGQSTVSYAYDPASRLIGVSDSLSNTAGYSYDAVGNLLSITNNLTSQVSIIGFDPTSGSPGIPVTISGTGFSTVPSQNSVTFNGIAAQVTSSTSGQLVATVPVSATTGTISITTPSGSATSRSPFGVVSSTTVPSISNFAPMVAAIGSALTINGTNFDSTPTNNVTLINRLASALVTSANQSSLSATIPANATTGYISVATSAGKAASSGYLYVVPTGYTVGQVTYTGILPFQSPTSVSFTSGSQISLLAFDGVAGQHIFLSLSESSGSNDFVVSLIAPSGITLSTNYASGAARYSPEIVLPSSGTYTIFTRADSFVGPSSVSVTLSGNIPPDAVAVAVPDGAPATVTTTTIGQNARITFAGSGGERINWSVLTNSFDPRLNLVLLTPSGKTINPITSAFPISLPETGTYTAFMQSIQQGVGSTGTLTLQIITLPLDITGATSINGSAFPVVLNLPHQRALITFSGTANQPITIRLTGNTICTVDISLIVMSTLHLQDQRGCANSFNLPSTTLPWTDPYTILITAEGLATGTISAAVTSP